MKAEVHHIPLVLSFNFFHFFNFVYFFHFFHFRNFYNNVATASCRQNDFGEAFAYAGASLEAEHLVGLKRQRPAGMQQDVVDAGAQDDALSCFVAGVERLKVELRALLCLQLLIFHF